MKKTVRYDQQVYYRIIALWVLCEAMLGGIIHAFRIPVSGLIVGSAAVICISLIAFYSPVKGAIIKATIIVSIFKMMLSPQAPILAYVAVFFQGALGELLFWNRRFYRIACLLLGFFALLESGFQRIIVLTVVYGNNFWKAINGFFYDLTGRENNYSFYFIAFYVSLHVITGLIIGWWAGIIPKRILNWQIQFALFKLTAGKIEPPLKHQRKKRRKFKIGLLIIWISLIALYVQSYFGKPILPSDLPLKIFVRSIIIVLTWYFLIGPLTKFLLQSWLRKKQDRQKAEIEKIAAILPETKRLLKDSWAFSSEKKGLPRILLFSKLVIAKSLIAEGEQKKVVILSADIQTGKTTSLVNWISEREDVAGILTPVINEKRFFLNIATGEKFPMEADDDEREVLSIGRYRFSKSNFEKAASIIRHSIKQSWWLIIDEIGPLELKEQGFHDVLVEALQGNDQNILLVVRSSKLQEVKNKFELEKAIIIDSVNLLEKFQSAELAAE